MYATFRIPVPGMQSGTTVDIKYSEDGTIRNYHTSVQVKDIDGEPYAIFYANHFTIFSIGIPISTFTINDNALSTAVTGVLLNADIQGATDMRFSNNGTARSTRTGYTT